MSTTFRLLLPMLALLLGACASGPKTVVPQKLADDGGQTHTYNKLSAARIAEIRRALIGRSFVLKEDWYEFARIDSDPHGGFGDPVPAINFSESTIRLGANNRQVASAGTAGRISGMHIYQDGMAVIADMDNGREAYFVILHNRPGTLLMGRHRHAKIRQTLADDNTSTAWVNQQLTYRTLRFVEAPPAPARSSTALPPPPPEPTLTALPGQAAPASPVRGAPAGITRVNATAVPDTVRRNETLRLQLDYVVDGHATLTVRETRILTFGDVTLPGYPKTRSLQRAPGDHSSAINQPIPGQAAAGSYRYSGEVCVADQCATATTVFEVVP